jgi:hypothetical protein
MPPSVGTPRMLNALVRPIGNAIRRYICGGGIHPKGLACNLLENAEVRRERKGERMGNSLLASPHAGIKSNGPRKLLAKTVAAVAIAVFWCISAVGTTVGTAVGTTVGVTSLAAAVTAATSTTAEAGRRRRRRRYRRRRYRGGPWFWYWGPYWWW